MINQTYYISSGAKNAMFTLRCLRTGGLVAAMYDPDFYICNLAIDEDRAIEKASVYVEAMRERIGETADFKINFDPYPARELNKRRGKLSVRDSRSLGMIEEGVFPFGKHVGTKIVDAPDNYVLYFADKSKEEQEFIMSALSGACMGVALEKGLIAKREEAREERAKVDSLSAHIGTVGERREFEGEVVMCFEKSDVNFGGSYFINKIRCGDDIVSYIGSKALGKIGEVIKFKATIKAHDVYQGIKSTKVSRPA